MEKSISANLLVAATISSCVMTALATYALVTKTRRKAEDDSDLPHHSHMHPCTSATCGGGHHGKRTDPYDPSPRAGYLEWDDYFMALAFLSAERSKDPNKQVGACIVGDNKVVLGIGYNGFPRGCGDSKLPWAKKSKDRGPLGTKYPYVVHAEANALLNKNTASVEGAGVYVTMFPCNECAKLLIQAGIREVVYHESKVQEKVQVAASSNEDVGSGDDQQHEVDPCYLASKQLLTMAGVKLRQHRLKRKVVLEGK